MLFWKQYQFTFNFIHCISYLILTVLNIYMNPKKSGIPIYSYINSVYILHSCLQHPFSSSVLRFLHLHSARCWHNKSGEFIIITENIKPFCENILKPMQLCLLFFFKLNDYSQFVFSYYLMFFEVWSSCFCST